MKTTFSFSRGILLLIKVTDWPCQTHCRNQAALDHRTFRWERQGNASQRRMRRRRRRWRRWWWSVRLVGYPANLDVM